MPLMVRAAGLDKYKGTVKSDLSPAYVPSPFGLFRLDSRHLKPPKT